MPETVSGLPFSFGPSTAASTPMPSGESWTEPDFGLLNTRLPDVMRSVAPGRAVGVVGDRNGFASLQRAGADGIEVEIVRVAIDVEARPPHRELGQPERVEGAALHGSTRRFTVERAPGK